MHHLISFNVTSVRLLASWEEQGPFGVRILCIPLRILPGFTAEFDLQHPETGSGTGPQCTSCDLEIVEIPAYEACYDIEYIYIDIDTVF